MPDQLHHELRRFTGPATAGWYYGPWIIEVADWLRPHPSFDYDFRHEDYDGPGDTRCGSGADVYDCIEQINEMEEQA